METASCASMLATARLPNIAINLTRQQRSSKTVIMLSMKARLLAYKSYSYRFEIPDRVFVFTGDTSPSDAVAELAQGADLLVTETSSCEDRK